MSYNLVESNSRFLLDGDINAGKGMFGQSSGIASTNTNPLSHVPSTNFRKYYNKYIIDISNTVPIGIFNLASIGTDVAIGHSLTIECIATIPNANILRVVASDLSIKAELVAGDKIFLQAIGSTSNWDANYTVPLGTNNHLIVYTGQYPRVRTLPIQKEFWYNANYEYSIRSITSFDISDSTFILPTIENNLHKIISEGSINLLFANQNPLVPITGQVLLSALSTKDCTFLLQDGSPIIASIISCTNCDYEQLKFAQNLLICASQDSFIDLSSASVANVHRNILLAASNSSTFTISSNLGLSNTAMIASPTNSCSNLRTVNIAACNGSVIQSSIGGTFSSVDRCLIFGDNVTTLELDGSFSQGLAFSTMLSSYNTFMLPNALKNRYLVYGGFNGVKWSIDSKTGIHYGSGFVGTQPLPGFSEMYENHTNGELQLGRLVKFYQGKIVYCNDGEMGLMITRPSEGAAFLGGNPIEWPKKYLRDVFGRQETETINISQAISEINASIYFNSIQKQAIIDSYSGLIELKRPKINPLYDPNLDYIPRIDRPNEWSVCEKMGRVIVEHNGTLTDTDQYVISANNGIAKRTILAVTNIRVLRIISTQYAEVDIVPYFGI
jgi:Peptidase_G2, IMC autoproteolytic cleavage domain